MPEILVVNAYPERRSKYDARYALIPAVDTSTISIEELSQHRFMPNASEEMQRKRVSCFMSHMLILWKIVNENLSDVVVLEDDTFINNWTSLGLHREVLVHQKEFCYLGGIISGLLQKDTKNLDKEAIRSELIEGVNIIACDKWKITGAFAYYIPNADIAHNMLSFITGQMKCRKTRPFDVYLAQMQKSGYIKSFIYPALCVMDVAEAKKGFTGYFVKDNAKYY
tara:strand:+ start:579 stop:1250 length:672 start_codon:yes stop_codon:yes gene_type:complete